MGFKQWGVPKSLTILTIILQMSDSQRLIPVLEDGLFNKHGLILVDHKSYTVDIQNR